LQNLLTATDRPETWLDCNKKIAKIFATFPHAGVVINVMMYRRGYEMIAIFDQYLALSQNDTSCIVSHNGVPLFDVEYLRNGTR